MLELDLDLDLDLASISAPLLAPSALARGGAGSAAQAHLDELIEHVLERPSAARCTCGLSVGTTRREIRALGAGCSAATAYRLGWVCPTLDALRRLANL